MLPRLCLNGRKGESSFLRATVHRAQLTVFLSLYLKIFIAWSCTAKGNTAHSPDNEQVRGQSRNNRPTECGKLTKWVFFLSGRAAGREEVKGNWRGMFDTSYWAGFTVETWAAGLGVAWLGCDWRERDRDRERKRHVVKSYACAVRNRTKNIIIISRFTRSNMSVSQQLTYAERFHGDRSVNGEETCSNTSHRSFELHCVGQTQRGKDRKHLQRSSYVLLQNAHKHIHHSADRGGWFRRYIPVRRAWSVRQQRPSVVVFWGCPSNRQRRTYDVHWRHKEEKK